MGVSYTQWEVKTQYPSNADHTVEYQMLTHAGCSPSEESMVLHITSPEKEQNLKFKEWCISFEESTHCKSNHGKSETVYMNHAGFCNL